MKYMCNKGYKIQVCMSGVGFYIGTTTEFGLPMCRLSTEYYRSIGEAQFALDTGTFTVRDAVEVKYCCGGTI